MVFVRSGEMVQFYVKECWSFCGECFVTFLFKKRVLKVTVKVALPKLVNTVEKSKNVGRLLFDSHDV